MENIDIIKVADFVFRFILHSSGRKEIQGRESLSPALKRARHYRMHILSHFHFIRARITRFGSPSQVRACFSIGNHNAGSSTS